MKEGNVRAVLVSVGTPPHVVEAPPAALWTVVGGIPERFTRFALTRFGRRVADVWCRDVPSAAPNRCVVTPMFLYSEFRGDISGPILITAGNSKSGEMLSMTEDEATKSIVFASRWPRIYEPEFSTVREHLRACRVRRVRCRLGERSNAP
jgi:hypothetical protein